MSFTVSTVGAGSNTLSLRDAVYVGSSGGRARLLTVWLTQDSGDNSLLLSSGDSTKQPREVADMLARRSLAGSTFAVIPVEIGWQDWVLAPADDSLTTPNSQLREICDVLS